MKRLALSLAILIILFTAVSAVAADTSPGVTADPPAEAVMAAAKGLDYVRTFLSDNPSGYGVSPDVDLTTLTLGKAYRLNYISYDIWTTKDVNSVLPLIAPDPGTWIFTLESKGVPIYEIIISNLEGSGYIPIKYGITRPEWIRDALEKFAQLAGKEATPIWVQYGPVMDAQYFLVWEQKSGESMLPVPFDMDTAKAFYSGTGFLPTTQVIASIQMKYQQDLQRVTPGADIGQLLSGGGRTNPYSTDTTAYLQEMKDQYVRSMILILAVCLAVALLVVGAAIFLHRRTHRRNRI